jgi:enamine deaminase RidA (YjgF/YER057c/UK114 family)
MIGLIGVHEVRAQNGAVKQTVEVKPVKAGSEGLPFSEAVAANGMLYVSGQNFNGVFPARVCIAVQDLPLGANIEIAAIARQKAL